MLKNSIAHPPSRVNSTGAGLLRVLVRTILALGLILGGLVRARGQGVVDARIETTLPTWSTNRAVLAMDGNRDTYFQSRRSPDENDSFTVIFSHSIYPRRIEVQTGDDNGADHLVSGTLEVAPDTTRFKTVGEFSSGSATASLTWKPVRAVRIRPGKAQKDWLVLREIVFDPPLRIPKLTQGLCVTMDSSESPDLADWGRQARDLCVAWWPRVVKLLPSKGYEPPLSIRLRLVERLTGGVGVTLDTDIRLLASHIREQPGDAGVVIHELAHVIQGYGAALTENHGRRPPVWLMEGIADYIRYYHFEGTAPAKRIDPLTSSYLDSYATAAVFLNWIEQSHTRDFVKTINADIRTGHYGDDIFKRRTGRTLDQLWGEFVGLSR